MIPEERLAELENNFPGDNVQELCVEVRRLRNILEKVNEINQEVSDFIVQCCEHEDFSKRSARCLIVYSDVINAMTFEARTGKVSEHFGKVEVFKERLGEFL